MEMTDGAGGSERPAPGEQDAPGSPTPDMQVCHVCGRTAPSSAPWCPGCKHPFVRPPGIPPADAETAGTAIGGGAAEGTIEPEEPEEAPTPARVYCRNCAAEIPPAAVYCPRCAVPVIRPEAVARRRPTAFGRRLAPIEVIGGLVFVCGLLMAAYYYFRFDEMPQVRTMGPASAYMPPGTYQVAARMTVDRMQEIAEGLVIAVFGLFLTLFRRR